MNRFFSRKSLLYSENSERSASEANAHSHQANVLSANSWLDQYMTNVRLWADEGCDAISMAIHAHKAEGASRNAILIESMHRISALVDRGRWFFPNQWSDEYGLNKEPAYRGIRQPILDCLVDAYDVAAGMLKANDTDQITILVRCQRQFVSEVQQVLNPRRRELEVARINEQFAISEKLRAIGPREG